MNKICKCLSFVTLNIQQFVPWWETSHHVQWFTEHGLSENENFLLFFYAAKVCITYIEWMNSVEWVKCVYISTNAISQQLIINKSMEKWATSFRRTSWNVKQLGLYDAVAVTIFSGAWTWIIKISFGILKIYYKIHNCMQKFRI